MRRSVAAGAALLVVLGTAACGGGGSSEGGPTAPTSSTQVKTADVVESVEPTPSPSPDGEDVATVSQWASVIAGVDRQTRDAFEAWDTGVCLPSDMSDGDLFCNMQMQNMGTYAAVVSMELQAAANAGAPGYIGAPPAEIVMLVDETRDKADAAANAAGAAVDACKEGSCLGEAMAAMLAYDKLISALDSWSPYQ